MGGTSRALRLTHIIAVGSITGSRHTQPLARMEVAVFKSCMMTMDVDSRFARAGNSGNVQNLDVGKVGAVMVMVIIIVK